MAADQKHLEKQVRTHGNLVVVGGSLSGNPKRAVDLPRFDWRP